MVSSTLLRLHVFAFVWSYMYYYYYYALNRFLHEIGVASHVCVLCIILLLAYIYSYVRQSVQLMALASSLATEVVYERFIGY